MFDRTEQSWTGETEGVLQWMFSDCDPELDPNVYMSTSRPPVKCRGDVSISNKNKVRYDCT